MNQVQQERTEIAMKVKEKIMLDSKGLHEHGAINVVIFGDSVSTGAMFSGNDYENVYWNRLRRKLNAFRDYIPVNMINSAIGGTTAKRSLERLDRQVLKHEPDLVIVCFGLNDVNKPIEEYLSSLRVIFERCKETGCEVIFMTPNMLNTYVAEGTPEQYYDYAFKTAEMQNGGRMDEFIYSASDLARECGVTVCDCYSRWKELSKTQDTTKLLINRINHPTPEMHMLFADMLYDVIMGEGENTAEDQSTMYEDK